MPLTLTIRNVPMLENGSPNSLVLDRRGARIGRTPSSDWCLPDPTRYISSSHCEVRFSGEQYELIDQSTNGTFLMGQDMRLPVPYAIRPGDVFVIGRFEVEASLDDAAAASAAARNSQPHIPEWSGWESGTEGQDIAPQTSSSNWGAPPPSAAISGGGPMAQAWAPPTAAAPPPAADNWGAPAEPAAPASSPWGGAPPAPVTPASDWSSPAAPPVAPGADDIWGKFAASNVVDWSRSGFGAPPPPQVIAEPVQFQAAAPVVQARPPAASPAPVAPAQVAPPPMQTPASAPVAAAGLAQLLASAQVDPAGVKQGDLETAVVAGDLLRRLVAGLFVLLEARARAKSQMGAQGTAFSSDGNNPLKFARTPDQALLALLNPPERGFQSADRAVEDSFKDLQAHQMATLRAMQGALRATLDRFSPSAIRARAKDKGILSKILPGARDAALWSAYEKEFGGVVQGSDEAFMDMFAKEFRRAYEEIAGQR
jgi:type VI secretion system FHA domain protein